MKKRLISALLVSAMCLSLTACGGSGGSSDGGSSDGGGSSSGALRVAIWDNNQQPGIQEICDLFTEETGIDVQVEVKE